VPVGAGQTINIMTLGGLALAVGILVDDATVTIESINTQLEQGKPVEPAILEGAQQIALAEAGVDDRHLQSCSFPCSCSPVYAGYLFVPFAEVSCSPCWRLTSHVGDSGSNARQVLADKPHAEHAAGILARFQSGFDPAAGPVSHHAGDRSAQRPALRGIFLLGDGGHGDPRISAGTGSPGLGQDFFPSVDSGQILLHVRARTGLPYRGDGLRCAMPIERTVRQTIPASELATVVDNIGLPYSGINLAYSTSLRLGRVTPTST